MTNKQTGADQQNTPKSNEYQHTTQPNLTDITKENYGDAYQAHLVDQYKLYVEMTDKMSARRSKMNSFYISLLSGLLAFLSIVDDKTPVSGFRNIILLTIAILGLILCFLWYVNIHSYKQLNSGKFKVIYEMEQHLPFACYNKEWNILKKDQSHGGYLNHTRIEQYIPLALATAYFGLLIYSIFSLLK